MKDSGNRHLALRHRGGASRPTRPAPARCSRILALLVIAASLITPTAVIAAPSADSSSAPDPGKTAAIRTAVPGSYVVVFRDFVSLSSRVRVEEERGVEVEQTYRNAFKGFAGELDEKDVLRLRRDERVLLVEPDLEVTTQSSRPQARTVQSWGLDRVDQRDRPLDGRLDTSDDGFGVDAYIIDTGIRLDHNEFADRINPEGFSSIEGGWNDCDGHGTHVAGTVAGSSHGIAPAARLTAIRVLDCEGSGPISGVIAGIDWMIEDHREGDPAVANMSLGGSRSAAFNMAVTRAVEDGISVVVAAGNESEDACLSSPASAPEAVTVGSTDRDDAISDFSNIGTCVDIYAPGSDIRSAWHTSRSATNTISGTSMASPHVAGAAALILARNGDMSPEAVARRLTVTSTPDRITNAGCTYSRILFIGSGPDLTGSPLPPPPSNDDFENRRILRSLASTTARNTCATAETGEPGHGIPPYHYRATSSIWFEWTSPSRGTVTFDLEGSDFDALIAVYSGSSPDDLMLRSRIERYGWSRGDSSASLKVDPGTTYYIAVDGRPGDEGNARLSGTFTPGPGSSPGDRRPGPLNDNFAHATEIESSRSWSVSGDSEGATGQIGEPNHASWWSGGPFGSVWHRWTAPESGVLSLDSEEDVALYSGNSIRSLVTVRPSNECFYICEPVFPVRKGETYSIALDTWPGLEGYYSIRGTLVPAPSNDDFVNARRIGKWSGEIRGTTIGATREPHESGHGFMASTASSSVWFRWTAPWSGSVTLVTRASSDTDPDVAIYSGQALGSLRKVASSTFEQTTWSPVKGENYWIAVDTPWFGDPGPFSARLRRDLEDLRILSGPGFQTSSRTAKFRFQGEEGAQYQCRLNGEFRWRPCSERTTFRRLAPGERILKVRQKYGASYTDPAFYGEHWWYIERVKRR